MLTENMRSSLYKNAQCLQLALSIVSTHPGRYVVYIVYRSGTCYYFLLFLVHYMSLTMLFITGIECWHECLDSVNGSFRSNSSLKTEVDFVFPPSQ